MGVKHAHAMWAEVTLISHSPSKEEDAKRLGADHFLLLSDRQAMKDQAMTFDLIVNTVSAPIDLDPAINLLKTDGTMAYVGLPDAPLQVNVFALNGQRRRIAVSRRGVAGTRPHPGAGDQRGARALRHRLLLEAGLTVRRGCDRAHPFGCVPVLTAWRRGGTTLGPMAPLRPGSTHDLA